MHGNAEEVDAYQQATAVIVETFKRYNCLSLKGGTASNTALCKAAACGNQFMVEKLVTAGASLPPLGYYKFPPPGRLFLINYPSPPRRVGK